MPRIEIYVKGKIDPEMSDWFQGITIQPISADVSCLKYEAPDHSAIYGILSTLSTLRLSFISASVTDDGGTQVM